MPDRGHGTSNAEGRDTTAGDVEYHRITFDVSFGLGDRTTMAQKSVESDILFFEDDSTEEEEIRRILISPKSTGDWRPVVAEIRFEPDGFSFKEPAEDAVEWEAGKRPEWVQSIAFTPGAKRVLVLKVQNLNARLHDARFELVPNDPAVLEGGGKIDPTVVNNPVPPPGCQKDPC